VIVDANGLVAGRGCTQPGGRPHAETMALAQAGPRAKGATAYVTLEPCAHHGQTGPCAESLVAAGVARVVSAITDPDPRVAGSGHKLLEAKGVKVDIGLCAEEARALNLGFFQRVTVGRPAVTIKLATSLDGHMALASGESQWITGPEARAAAHVLRSRHDAILTGIGTVMRDDPRLDCRLAGLEARSPVAAVLDTHGRMPASAKVLEIQRRMLVQWCVGPDAAMAAHPNADILRTVLNAEGHISLTPVLQALGAKGVTRLLVEAGPRLTTAFLRAGLADEVVWFRGPLLLGAGSRSAVGPLDLAALAKAPRFRRVAVSQLGTDVMETYRPGA
jgi:diaminohydroxyphosphoribosylaminopyrimidine deaminase/5-amino-6-(5-phosphoribosylamino)uracil reductase